MEAGDRMLALMISSLTPLSFCEALSVNGTAPSPVSETKFMSASIDNAGVDEGSGAGVAVAAAAVRTLQTAAAAEEAGGGGEGRTMPLLDTGRPPEAPTRHCS